MVIIMLNLSIFLFLILPGTLLACSGSNNDYSIVQSPTLTLTFNPPALWTYPETDAQATLSFFPGQPLTQIEAQNNAQNDIKNAVVNSLTEIGIDPQGKNVVANYQAQMVHDCYKVLPTGVTNAVGSVYGILENGAITKLATLGGTAALSADACAKRNFAANPLTYTENVLTATVQINNLITTRYSLRQLANSIMSKLSFGNSVQFVGEITY
uniref:Lipoprotein n=1 Tax=Strongyloides papillosus TaxID=174720 RepID=A0A0N5CH55_STREA